ncbi:MAG: Ig-like domain-containing protein, partial [Actinomycetota bacterium]
MNKLGRATRRTAGLVALTAVMAAAMVVATGSVAFAAPGNDNLASASTISNAVTSITVSGTNVAATEEPNENLNTDNAFFGATVWWRWTAPSNGDLTLTTSGSDFDTTLEAYQGTSYPLGDPLNRLNQSVIGVTSNNDSGANTWSSIKFQVVSGRIYKIQVGGKDDGTGTYGSGSISLNLSFAPAPANDDFATAQALSGTSGSRASDSNTASTVESVNEQLFHGGFTGGRSVWYSWVAPSTGTMTATTSGSNFDTTIAAYTGSSINNLTLVADNNDVGALDKTSSISFPATSGVTYTFQVDGIQYTTDLNYADGYQGTLHMNWSETVSPPNDNFANAQTLSGASGSTTGSNQAATMEASEGCFNNSFCGATVWYTWQAPDSTTMTFDTLGSTFDTIANIYTGATLDTLSQVAGNDDAAGTTTSRITFTPTGGVTYKIQIGGKQASSDPAQGSIALHWGPPPANDNFASAITINGLSGSTTGSNARASKEDGEPNHAGNIGGASVWWRWTAPANGNFTFDTLGSGIDTVLAVYTGGDVGSLTSVASNNDCCGGTQSKASFDATISTVYSIAIDGNAGVTGPVTLSWTQTPPANDAFGAATTLTGGSGSVAGTNVGATKQTGEPLHAGNAGGRSVWFDWVAPGNGTIEFDTLGSNYDTLLGVYTGSAVNALTAVASSNDCCGVAQSKVIFSAINGTDYKIAVDGFNSGAGASNGTIALTWSAPPPDTTAPTASITSPANGASVASGVPVTVTAADDAGGSGVASVDLFVDDVNTASDATAPYSFALDTTG